MCDILQAADERPEPFSEEEVEAPGPGRSAASQKHDRETLGNGLCSQKVSFLMNIIITLASQEKGFWIFQAH